KIGIQDLEHLAFIHILKVQSLFHYNCSHKRQLPCNYSNYYYQDTYEVFPEFILIFKNLLYIHNVNYNLKSHRITGSYFIVPFSTKRGLSILLVYKPPVPSPWGIGDPVSKV